MIKGVEHLSHEERLKEQGHCSAQLREGLGSIQVDLTNVCKYLMGGNEKQRARHKLKH